MTFTPELKGALALTGVPRDGQPRPAYPVRLTSGGATLAGTFIAIIRVGGSFRIARVAPPAGYQSGGAGGEPLRALTSRLAGTWDASGFLAPYQVEWFELAAQRGERLVVSLEGFRGRDVLVRIVDRETGGLIDPKLRAGARRWAGRVPANGRYRIEVIRATPTGAARVAYAMTATLE
jgi:hypothetical protein